MTLHLAGQLDLFDMLPLVCQHYGEVCDASRPYDAHNYRRVHAEREPGVCAEMAWARRGYRHAVWAVENFGSWYELALPGSETYERQLLSVAEERGGFEDRRAAYTSWVGSSWLEQAACGPSELRLE